MQGPRLAVGAGRDGGKHLDEIFLHAGICLLHRHLLGVERFAEEAGVFQSAWQDLLAHDGEHGICFDAVDIVVILDQDLIAGTQLRFREDLVTFEQRDVLRVEVVGKGIHAVVGRLSSPRFSAALIHSSAYPSPLKMMR